MSETTSTANSGFSRDNVKSILNNFLDDKDNYKVLALKGKWGVGKTRLVQDFLSDNKNEYYYGSVFGISSVEQLKSQLLTNKKTPELNKQDTLTKSEDENSYIKKWWNRFLAYPKKIRDKFLFIINLKTQNTDRVDKIPNLGSINLEGLAFPLAGAVISLTSDTVLYLLFNNIKGSIICIDDLERKSKLQLEELLGFVEYLVQELECRVILIYNEEYLDFTSKEALKQYREKIIDIEVELKPTVEENLDFIFAKDNPDIEVIKSVFRNAGTNNIRVLRKTKWFIDELVPLMTNWEPSLREQVIKNTIVISLAKLDIEFNKRFSIDIETIISLSDLSQRDLSEKSVNDDETSEKRVQKRNTLFSLGFYKRELVDQIIKLVETSLFSPEEFIEKGKILNEKEIKSQIIQKYSSLWEYCHSSFGASEQEISEKILQFFENHYLDLSLNLFKDIKNLASSVRVDKAYNHYYKLFIKKLIHESEPKSWNKLKEIVCNFPDLEADLKIRIAAFQQAKDTKDITTVLKNICEKTYCPPEDIIFLNSCTFDEYTKWLLKGHPDLYPMVKECLRMNIVASQTLTEVIISLGKESPFKAHLANYFLYDK